MALTHIGMDCRELTKRRIGLRLGFYVLDSDRIQRNVCDRVAGFIDHVRPAVLAKLNRGYNII